MRTYHLRVEIPGCHLERLAARALRRSPSQYRTFVNVIDDLTAGNEEIARDPRRNEWTAALAPDRDALIVDITTDSHAVLQAWAEMLLPIRLGLVA